MMKRIILSLLCLLVLSGPTWAACAVTNLQVKDNAAVTAAVPYADDGSGGSNCSPQIQLKQGGNVAAVTAASALKVDPSAVTQPVSAASLPLPTGAATAALQNPVNVTPTDCSSTISVGGTAQNAIAASSTLHGFFIANIDSTSGSGEPLWISFTGSATAGASASYALAAPTVTTFAGMSSFTTPVGFATNAAVSVVAATNGHKYSCTKW